MVNKDFNLKDMLQRIKEIKKEKRITNEDISSIAEIPIGTLSKILSGIAKDPQISNIIKISNALSVSSDYLIFGQDTKTNFKLVEKEKLLIKSFRDLNEPGKKKAVDYLIDLSYNSNYRIDSSDIQQDKNEEKIAKYLNKTEDSPNYSTMDIAAQHEATVTHTYTKEESDKMDKTLEEIRKTFERPTKKR